MNKIDFKKKLKHLYNPTKDFSIVDIPEMLFLMIDGHGDPNNSQDYKDALDTLYSVAYKLKFFSKNSLEKDYVVPPLEGLWWAENMEVFTVNLNKSQWDWTMMIMTPGWITKEMFEDAVSQVHVNKNPIALGLLRFDTFFEGKSVQTMYIGSYSDEGPTISAMHDYIEEQGFSLCGKHHEIYLGDPRRTAPEKLKTIIRQPVCQG